MNDLKLKRLTTLSLVVILLFGCTSQVDSITKKISEGFETTLQDSLKTVSATISYYSYAVPTNYWYSEETTTKELIKDEFQYGDKKLQKLDADISEIVTNNDNINEAIQKLKLAIKQDRKQINKSREALQKVNFLFGLFGGAEGLVDFAALFGSKTDEDKIELPKNVKKAFLELNNQIEIAQYGLLQKANEIELYCIGSEKLTPEQRKDIRAFVIETLSNKIKQSYHGEDKETIKKISSNLVEQYDNLYTLNEVPAKNKEVTPVVDDATFFKEVKESDNSIKLTKYSLPEDFEGAAGCFFGLSKKEYDNGNYVFQTALDYQMIVEGKKIVLEYEVDETFKRTVYKNADYKVTLKLKPKPDDGSEEHSNSEGLLIIEHKGKVTIKRVYGYCGC